MVGFPATILMDLDNTVYPYEPCHQAGMVAAHRVARRMDAWWGKPAEFAASYAQARQEVKALVGPQAAAHSRLLYFKTMVETRLGHTDIRATKRLHDAYWRGYLSAMRPDPGCAELLHHLATLGVRLAWVSNYTTERQMLKLRALGLENGAQFLVTSEEAGAEKPSPAVIDLALQRLQARPEETWLVGDDPHEDVTAARARGLTAVWLRRESSPDPSEAPDIVVHSWFELAEALERCRGGQGLGVGGWEPGARDPGPAIGAQGSEVR